MNEFQDRVVAVTGGASGLGREIARRFAGRGARLVICDVNEPALDETLDEFRSSGHEALAFVADVSQMDQVSEFCDFTYREMGRVDVLCNNAGVAMAGGLEDTTIEDWEWIVGINLWGVIYGCHFFYPRMIEQGGGGHIVNTASGAALGPSIPAMSSYVCTKYGVLGFSEAFRGEAAVHGIGVSAVCPGLMTTNISKTARICSGTAHSSREEMAGKVDRFFTRLNRDPGKVADAVVRAVEHNKGVVPVGFDTRLTDISHRLSRRGCDWYSRRSAEFMKKRL